MKTFHFDLIVGWGICYTTDNGYGPLMNNGVSPFRNFIFLSLNDLGRYKVYDDKDC